MNYDEALDEAKNKAEQFPQFKRNGRVWVRVGDKEFPKDWFVRSAVLEEIRKYKRQSVMEKKQHSLWNRPVSDVMNGTQQNSTKSKSRRKLRLKPEFINWVACMNLENDRMLRVRSYKPGHVSVELIDCFVPSRPRNQ